MVSYKDRYFDRGRDNCKGIIMCWTQIEDEPKLKGYEWADLGGTYVIKSGDKTYNLKQLSRASLSCDCKGYGYRGYCKHSTYLQGKVNLIKVPREWAKQYVEQAMSWFTTGKPELHIAGSYLRGRELIKDLDFVCVMDEGCDLVKEAKLFCTNLPEVFKPTIEPKSGRIIRGCIDDVKYDFYLCYPSEYGAMLMFLTGPKEFNIFCRKLAERMGYKLNQYGLYLTGVELEDSKLPEKVCEARTEQEIFQHLKLDWISPEEREKWAVNK